MALSLSLPALPRRSQPPVSRTPIARSPIERLWITGGVIVALLLVLIGYLFFIGPQRSQTDDVDGQVAAARSQNAALEQRLEALRAQSRNLGTYQAQLRAAELALPAGDDIARFLRSLEALGAASLVKVTMVSVNQPTPVAPPLPAGTASAAAGGAASAAAGGATHASGGGAAQAPSLAGVVSYAISVQLTGSPSALVAFLDQLQSVQPRAVLISQLSESVGTGTGAPAGAATAQPGQTSLQLQMLAYARPAPSGPPAAAQSPAPSPAPTR